MRILDNSIYSSNAVPCGGAEGSFFFTISSKNATCRFNICNCVQDTSNDSASFTFTGKEKDSETGYGYFGARYMDHELMTMWLSVDPMADKYPSISPYAYCAWNPVKLIDPDGNDWYQNELTGSIYYNSKVKGADAAGTGAMKGEGWKHLGANGMFSTDGLHNSDWDIVRRNNGKMNYNEWTNSFDMELSLDGDKAKSVMKSVGYQQVPTQVITYNDTYTQDMSGLQDHTFHLTYGNEYEYAEKIAYIPDSYRESGRSIVGKTEYGKYDPFKNSMPYANRQTIRYSESSTFVKVLGVIFSGLEIVHGGHHDYVDKNNMGNISNYRGGNVLIDRILAR